ncbi:cation:proton antiporter [Tenuibacillus multivorans]|uniref:NhaP-type Na+/H+ or K+/H+ antiporter n=1 Tax=Tenuibacillus multivorans TaxID=237069 RepID=A0A1G9WW44_9BACI|nr:sodium:proton antiporter [Tenuibacillus multivorans]GEL78401.1 sodium/hydrogen exchanger [Tenuibacillus multivorans]SDM88738.1 NhaP-type Na+/H+ or K+/H+ antiporter [Tenuibacillus multivorans]
MESLLFKLMLIGSLGVVSQWIAWRYRMPAIVVMSVMGLLAGPIFGIINPQQDLGELYGPLISIAVGIILFEGSLNLDFREIKGLGRPIGRITTIGAFLAWVIGSLAAHYIAGLSWAVAFVIGAIFIVTGPTVILPLLRQAKLKPRPAAILKWEGIIVDPFGALLAVFAYEFIKFLTMDQVTFTTVLSFLFASLIAVIIGAFFGYGIGWMFEKGFVPEYLKSPVVLVSVIMAFVFSDTVMHETGLLAVTVMGITIANMHISSIGDMRHFKENISILLISVVFILLTASLNRETLLSIFDWHIIFFILFMLFINRPLSIFLSTINTDLTLKEKLLVGWIAPRGIVALTVSGYFAEVLLDAGFADADILTSLTFGLVFATVCAHGFSLSWIAKKLGLSAESKPGVLIVGSSKFSANFAKVLEDLNIPVLISDSSWSRLSHARRLGVPYEHGEILSEQTDYQIDLTPYEYMISLTEYDSYNTLISSTFTPAFGRQHLYQLPLQVNQGDQLEDVSNHISGRLLFEERANWSLLNEKINKGYLFKRTMITEQFSFEQFLEELNDESILLLVVRKSGSIDFFTPTNDVRAETGDTVVSLQKPNQM